MAVQPDPWIADEALCHLEGPIGGSVVDHDELLDAWLQKDPTDHLSQGGCLVEGGHDHREVGVHIRFNWRPEPKFAAGLPPTPTLPPRGRREICTNRFGRGVPLSFGHRE